MLAVALAIGLVSSRLSIPYSVALVLVGLGLTMVQHRFAPIRIGPDSLILFLPPLIFEGAWNLNLAALKGMAGPIAVLAVPGVLFAALLIALAATVIGKIPFATALILGAILAATDPVAVIAIFRRLRVPTNLATLIEGESIANDGVAMVLYQLIIPLSLGAAVPHVLPLISWFFISAAGGVAVGFAIALAAAFILRATRDRLFQVLGTIIVAYGAYVLADAIHVSGIFATAVAAVVLKALEFFPSNAEATESVEQFWSVAAFITNALVFLVMGLTLRLDRLLNEPVLLLAVFLTALAARAIPSYTVLRAFRALRDRRWSHVIAASGLRGGLAIALALGLPASVPNRAAIIDTVFGVVLLTLVLQGIPMSRIVSFTAREEARSP